MTDNLKFNIYFYTSLILAVWFLLTSWAWFYYANLFYSFPFGVISLILWYKGKNKDSRPERYNIIKWILINGAIFSLAFLIFFKFLH